MAKKKPDKLKIMVSSTVYHFKRELKQKQAVEEIEIPKLKAEIKSNMFDFRFPNVSRKKITR